MAPKEKGLLSTDFKVRPVSDHTGKQNEVLKWGQQGEEELGDVQVQVLEEGPPEREWGDGQGARGVKAKEEHESAFTGARLARVAMETVTFSQPLNWRHIQASGSPD